MERRGSPKSPRPRPPEGKVGPEDREFRQDGPAVRPGGRGYSDGVGAVQEAEGEKLAGLSGEERSLKRYPGEPEWGLSTRRGAPHSRSWASAHLRVANGHGGRGPLRHYEGGGAHRD